MSREPRLTRLFGLKLRPEEAAALELDGAGRQQRLADTLLHTRVNSKSAKTVCLFARSHRVAPLISASSLIDWRLGTSSSPVPKGPL